MMDLDPADAALYRSMVRDKGVPATVRELDVDESVLRRFLEKHPSEPGEWMS